MRIRTVVGEYVPRDILPDRAVPQEKNPLTSAIKPPPEP